jgi:FtsP/CotA-like multicopper oxidase with cupredoxin domain
MSRSISRRSFLAKGSLALAGIAVAPGVLAQRMGGGGGMGGGGSTVVDPPVGAPLQEPPVAGVRSGDVLDVALEAAVTQELVNGSWASLLTYGGEFVAPTIRAKRGDRVRLHFRNGLPANGATTLLGHPKYVTNVHVHGWHVSPGTDMASGRPADDVHLTLAPGASQDYEYDLSLQRPGSLGLYHPHVHGSVAEQFWGGLVGALDVQDDPIVALAPYRRRLALLKDITLASGAPAPYTMMRDYMQGKEGSLCTVNGQVNPALDVEPGEVFRLRLVNASNARFYRLQLQSHAMYVVGTDGGLLDRPYPMTELLLSPGERADLLFKAPSTSGSYKLLALPYARMGMMTSSQVTLMTVRVKSTGLAVAKSIPSAVDPDARRLDASAPAAARQTFALSMSQGRGYVNGQTFQVLSDGSISAFMHMSEVGTEEIWEVTNQSNMDHPWHQHVNDAQLIAYSGGDASYAKYAQLYQSAPAWKDTIIVPKAGSVTLRIPIADHSGMTMFHCHILEHEDIGMMGMWHIMGGMGGGM